MAEGAGGDTGGDATTGATRASNAANNADASGLFSKISHIIFFKKLVFQQAKERPVENGLSIDRSRDLKVSPKGDPEIERERERVVRERERER